MHPFKVNKYALTKMANSVIEDYVAPHSEDKKPPPPINDPDIETKRESLAVLFFFFFFFKIFLIF